MHNGGRAPRGTTRERVQYVCVRHLDCSYYFFNKKSKGLPLPVTMLTHPHIHHQLNNSDHLLFTRSTTHSSSRYAMSLNHETQMNANAGPHLPETPQGAFEEAVLSAVDKEIGRASCRERV